MGRIVELLVALNAAGGIATFWSFRMRSRKRRREQFERIQRELDDAKRQA